MSLSYVEATWTPTTLDDEFDHYEIERTEDGGETFYQVAEITTEAVDIYRDYEAQRDNTAGYRLRVVRTDGAVSDWTAVEQETIPVSTEWAFVSNEAPDLNIEVTVASDEDEAHKWGTGGPEKKEYPIAGRDGAVVLISLEDNLDLFTVNVLYSSTATDGLERAVGEELRAICNERISYVCVHSPGSWRWLADVTPGDMDQSLFRQKYVIPTRVRELTKVPSIIDIAEV